MHCKNTKIENKMLLIEKNAIARRQSLVQQMQAQLSSLIPHPGLCNAAQIQPMQILLLDSTGYFY